MSLHKTTILAAVFTLNATVTQAQTTLRPSDGPKWDAIAGAENARAATSAQLALILAGTHDPTTELRRISVRALGRLQRNDLADSIARSLHDAAPSVRAEAAHALALASIANRAPNAVRDTVRAALSAEHNPEVIGALAETLGRLRNANADSARIVAAQLIPYLSRNDAAQFGAVRGLHFIVRQPAAIRAGLDTARTALTLIATGGTGSNGSRDTSAAAEHARRLATETLALAGLGSEQAATAILHDVDPVVRREAILIAALSSRDTAAARRIIKAGLADNFWLVRFEAMKQYGIRFAAAGPCADIERFTRDNSMHVRLEAIDIIGSRCSANARTTSLLDSIARTLPATTNGEWHPAAHAIVALANRDPSRARARIASFGSHPNFFVRTYAANAAAALRDESMLKRLAGDRHANVRTAAVHALRTIDHHGADSIYLAQLSIDDSQLLMEAAGALDSTTTPGVADKLLDALDRVTAQKRENSRDGRMALLNVVAHLGSASLTNRLTQYLRDYDPQVAARAAAALKQWTGTEQTATPQLLPPEPMPSFTEINSLSTTKLRVEMQNGDVFYMRLLPFDAPTNAARFARLIRSGYFNGLTLHRIEPSFVVQGGSPNANEYTGAPRFTRDEIGYRNDRGTVGLSTRGHDTGDAQIFINSIDNTQLDPLYTVFAEVTSGMSMVDRILEGNAIAKITITK